MGDKLGENEKEKFKKDEKKERRKCLITSRKKKRIFQKSMMTFTIIKQIS